MFSSTTDRLMFYRGVASGVHARLTSSNNAGHENNKRTRANRGEKAGGPQNKLCTAHNRLIVQAAPKYNLNPFHHTSHSLCFFVIRSEIIYPIQGRCLCTRRDPRYT